jgi:urease accessory protein
VTGSSALVSPCAGDLGRLAAPPGPGTNPGIHLGNQPGVGAPVDPTGPSGWCAELHLGFAERGGRTVIAEGHHLGPLTVQRAFYPEGAVAHCYVLHPPGGVVGGDRLELDLGVGEGAQALITAPGATKLYRSAGADARVTQRLRVAAGGVLEWLPQETILFPGARARIATELHLAVGARFIGWEVSCLGRPAIDERFTAGHADLGLAIRRDGRPLLLERLRVCDGAGLDGASGLRGYSVVATLVATGGSSDDLEAVRDGIGAEPSVLWAATRVEDLLVVRVLAGYAEPAHRLVRAVWGILRPRLLDRPPCPPRIWGT